MVTLDTEKFVKSPPLGDDLDCVANALGKMDVWLESMRQDGGYGGPVAHWWNHCMIFTGPAVDWRYEGILAGYHNLYQKTGYQLWKERLKEAVKDVINGQLKDGSYRCSRFELNPGSLGTPHESAATLGLLLSFPTLQNEQIVVTAKRNIDHLVQALWDENDRGFNDRPGFPGRVPNKLSTFAETLLNYYSITGDEKYLWYAENALDGVLKYQVKTGVFQGAIHQYGQGAGIGDNKFFPYYNARCIPPLVKGALLLNHTRYADAAEAILEFVRRTMNEDGSWPQIVYGNGARAEFPRWVAGTADILRAYVIMGQEVPATSYARLLNRQLESGGFPTAEGFEYRIRKATKPSIREFRDVLPVVGWNDKVFRFLSEKLEINQFIPAHAFQQTEVNIREGKYIETEGTIQLRDPSDRISFQWNKNEPWSKCIVELQN